jgi:hypothetical protein
MKLCSTHITKLQEVSNALHRSQQLNADRTTLILAPANRNRMNRAEKKIDEAIILLKKID